MSYQKQIFSLIAKLSGSKHKIVADPYLCQFMGSLEGGVFLSQLLYWSDKGAGEWFYKSYKDWQSEIFLSQYQVNRYAKLCVEKEFLEVKLRKANGHPTVYYKVDGQKFLEAIMKFLNLDYEIFDNGKSNFQQSENQIFDKPVTETTQETTSEITTENKSSSARAKPELTEPQADDDDDDFMDSICKALQDEVSLRPTPHRKARLREFARAHGPDTVIRGIMAASDAGGETFAYVLKCITSQADASPRGNDTSYSPRPEQPRRNYRPAEYADIILGAPSPEQLAMLEAETEPTP